MKRDWLQFVAALLVVFALAFADSASGQKAMGLPSMIPTYTPTPYGYVATPTAGAITASIPAATAIQPPPGR